MKEKALQALSELIDSLVLKKAAILTRWVLDYAAMLKKENTASNYRRYFRGEIIRVNLGYRIGSEEGGIHLAVVINKHDSIYSPVLTVIPLTSIKGKYPSENARPGNVVLGSEIQQKLYTKAITNKSPAMDKELSTIKWGSIALVNQITTISKLRIVNPLQSTDSLHKIKLSNASMDALDNEIKTIFTGLT